MATYLDKYSSNITNSTTNRGVEAKETEIANTHLEGGDVESACSSCSAQPPAHRASPSLPQDCPSYLQVVVEKHCRTRAPAPALAASSPAPAHAPAPAAVRCMGCGCGAGDAACKGAERHPILAYYLGADVVNAGCDAGRGATVHQQYQKAREMEAEAETECVEVYRFMRVGAALAAGGGGGAKATEAWRRSQGVRRGARAVAAEVGAGARLAVGAPLWGTMLLLRWGLQMARDVVAGAVHAVADYALKPTLVLLFNALLHPLLVFTANVLQGVYEAVRPLCAMMGDCATHLATVLGALRLVGATSTSCRCASLPHPP